MPIIKSAKKALRQSRANNARNTYFKGVYTQKRKAFENAIKNKDLKQAQEVFFNTKKDGKTVNAGLQAVIDKLVKKHIIHPKNGDRKKSKFSHMLKSLESSLSS